MIEAPRSTITIPAWRRYTIDAHNMLCRGCGVPIQSAEVQKPGRGGGDVDVVVRELTLIHPGYLTSGEIAEYARRVTEYENRDRE